MADYEIRVLETDLFDTRVRRRNMEKGRMEPQDLRSHLDALPDLGDEGEEFRVVVGQESEDEREL